MTEIMQYAQEKLDWAAGAILELLTGLPEIISSSRKM
jgi:hypothetical protein